MTEEQLKEVKKLLGIHRSYFYIEDGIVYLDTLTYDQAMIYVRTLEFAKNKKQARQFWGRDWDC